MYTPAPFAVDDPEELHRFVREFSFGMLVTVSDGIPTVSHLPFLLDMNRGATGVLAAHVARANPQWRDFREDIEALVVFAGPHAYVSPSWYAVHPAVPTWNYATVHAYGVARVVPEARLREIVLEMVETYESERENPWRFDASEAFTRPLLRAIVGFEIELTRLEGKYKLSQNRQDVDRRNVEAALGRSGNSLDRETAGLMRRLRLREQ